jgi:hypothetical protein
LPIWLARGGPYYLSKEQIADVKRIQQALQEGRTRLASEQEMAAFYAGR